jgi:hypothetical protein
MLDQLAVVTIEAVSHPSRDRTPYLFVIRDGVLERDEPERMSRSPQATGDGDDRSGGRHGGDLDA